MHFYSGPPMHFLTGVDTYVPLMQALFGTRPLSLAHGFLIVGIGAALFTVLEVEKHARRVLFTREQPLGDIGQGFIQP